jgi:predicted XRE-type DNA-binding protein
MTNNQTFATVWDAIEDTPEDAAAMKLRADVMIAITGKVRSWKVTQREAARRLGITQPRLNELLKGRISRFSLDALMVLAPRAGLTVKIAIRDSNARAAARTASGVTVPGP